ncbi:MAG: GTPase [Oscillospiraceae bacterium]
MVGRIIFSAAVAIGGAICAVSVIHRKRHGVKIQTAAVSPDGVNILLCGATGAGKSSILNDILGGEYAKCGEGKATTVGIQGYESENGAVLYDTEGYTIENISDYKGMLDSFIRENSVTEVWYCVNAESKRFTDTDAQCIDFIRDVLQMKNLCVILSKADAVSFSELTDLHRSIAAHFPEIKVYSYTTKSQDSDLYKNTMQSDKEELLQRLTLNKEDSYGNQN